MFVKGQCIGGGTGELKLVVNIFFSFDLTLLFTDTQSLYKQGKLQDMLK